MNRQAIMVADKDAKYRNCAAAYFQKAGYQVETADSAEKAVNGVLENGTSVLLLGSNLVESASMADLVHLLKTLNNHLHIIMVSDELTLAETLQVRAAGIFYQVLRSAAAGDIEELGQAVACAFGSRVAPIASQPEAPAPAMATADRRFGRAQFGKLLPWIAGVFALSLGAGMLSLREPAAGESHLITWIFIGFVALIITNQLLPIFRVKLALDRIKEWKAARSGAHRGGR
jgi:DNA-binding NarL/FixJ family response regulator